MMTMKEILLFAEYWTTEEGDEWGKKAMGHPKSRLYPKKAQEAYGKSLEIHDILNDKELLEMLENVLNNR